MLMFEGGWAGELPGCAPVGGNVGGSFKSTTRLEIYLFQ